MDLESIFTPEEISKLFIRFSRLNLDRKPHIKKYNKLRTLHNTIVNGMQNFMFTKYGIQENIMKIAKQISKETKNLRFCLDNQDPDNITILTELCVYKNHSDIKSITEIYLEKNKFRNEEKIKMLQCMQNSFASLFKITSTNPETGYVTYEDVFTKKKYQVIDVSMSSTFGKKDYDVYIYNRLITYEDITFGTGMHIVASSNNKELLKFIKNHNFNKCSSYSRCLMLYYISKLDNTIQRMHNN